MPESPIPAGQRGTFVPAKHQALAWKLWDDANEADITRTARALTPVLRAMEVPHE